MARRRPLRRGRWLVQRRRDTHAALRLMRKLLRNRASHRSCWSPTSGAPMAQLSGDCASPALMIGASEKTIAPKTPIKSCGDESAKWNGSNRLDPRSDFSTSIPPSTTPSTINDISSLGPHFGPSEPKQPPSGKMRLPSNKQGLTSPPLCTPPVTVTMPSRIAGRHHLGIGGRLRRNLHRPE
jgi:hypothetical protein